MLTGTEVSVKLYSLENKLFMQVLAVIFVEIRVIFEEKYRE